MNQQRERSNDFCAPLTSASQVGTFSCQTFFQRFFFSGWWREFTWIYFNALNCRKCFTSMILLFFLHNTWYRAIIPWQLVKRLHDMPRFQIHLFAHFERKTQSLLHTHKHLINSGCEPFLFKGSLPDWLAALKAHGWFPKLSLFLFFSFSLKLSLSLVCCKKQMF